MIKCPKCGAELADGTTVCPKCGAPIAPAPKTLKAETAPAAGKAPLDNKIAGALAGGIIGIVACIIGIFFAGIICGCIAIATGIAGIITSTKAMKEGKRGGLTMAALIVSIVSVGFGAIILILSIISTILVTMAAVA